MCINIKIYHYSQPFICKDLVFKTVPSFIKKKAWVQFTSASWLLIFFSVVTLLKSNVRETGV